MRQKTKAATPVPPVTTEELLALADASDAYHQQCEGGGAPTDDEDHSTVGIFLAGQQAKGDYRKAVALWARMSALASIIKDEGAHGWTFPNGKGDGGVFLREPVFAAAAVHPVIWEKGSEARFDRASFLDRVLALAEPETRG